MGRVSALVAITLAASAGLGVARADGEAGALAQAQAALDASDYAAAGSAVESALASGTNSPDELAQVYKLRGVVAAAVGNAAAATDAFAHLLALRPDATLPPGTSPKIMRPFAAAQDAARTRGALQVSVETAAGTPTAPPSLTMVIAHDPFAMVVKARATISVDGKPAPAREATGKDRIAIELPRGARVEVQLAALDERGNRIVELGTSEPIVIVSVLAPVVVRPVAPPPHARPVYLTWWLYGGVAVAAAAVGGGFWLEANSARNELAAINADSVHHTFPEAQHEESRARHDLTVANVGFVTAGLFAFASGALLGMRLRDARAREHAQLVPTVARGGAGLALEMPW